MIKLDGREIVDRIDKGEENIICMNMRHLENMHRRGYLSVEKYGLKFPMLRRSYPFLTMNKCQVYNSQISPILPHRH